MSLENKIEENLIEQLKGLNIPIEVILWIEKPLNKTSKINLKHSIECDLLPMNFLVLKKCKKEDDVLFINASEQYEKGKRQNTLGENHLDSIVETYKYRNERERYSRRVSMDEIEKNGYNLNISRYVSTSLDEVQIDLKAVNEKSTSINESIKINTEKHNEFLKELGLKPI